MVAFQGTELRDAVLRPAESAEGFVFFAPGRDTDAGDLTVFELDIEVAGGKVLLASMKTASDGFYFHSVPGGRARTTFAAWECR